MVDVKRTITIDRDVSDVFAYLDDPENHVEISPSLTAVRDIRPLDNGGKRVTHTYSMAGVSLDGELEQVTHLPNEQMVFEMRGDLDGQIGITFAETPDGTEVTYGATYELPGRVLGTVATPFVKRYNERELRTTLENLKTRLEAA